MSEVGALTVSTSLNYAITNGITLSDSFSRIVSVSGNSGAVLEYVNVHPIAYGTNLEIVFNNDVDCLLIACAEGYLKIQTDENTTGSYASEIASQGSTKELIFPNCVVRRVTISNITVSETYDVVVYAFRTVL